MYYAQSVAFFIVKKKNAFFQWRVSRARTLKRTQVYILFFTLKQLFFL